MPDITRRDFLDGCALTVAAGLTPLAQLAKAQPVQEPPARSGLRGHHPGSFEVAHAMRDGEVPDFSGRPIDEDYDLVVVGAGISGLSAAYFYRKRRPDARILILDNHDDFGGHAKRNEFTVDGQLILGYGGSESLQSPKALWSPVAKGLIKELGVDIGRFDTAFERNLYPSMGLSRGVFFPRESFERDALVTGDPMHSAADDLGPGLLNAKPVADFVAGFPVGATEKAQILSLYDAKRDPLAGKSVSAKEDFLGETSYRDYLTKACGLSERAANCFHGRSLDFFALASDMISAADAREMGLPGFDGLGLPADASPERDEPYIHHFPDGNASLARLLVRALIPGIAPGNSMDDIVLASFRYDLLDQRENAVRIRLQSTCVNVRDGKGGVEIAYVRNGGVHRVRGARAILAGFNSAIPYMMPGLPEEQRNALLRNVKAPLVYTKVVVRNWEPWARLGVHEISGAMSFHCRVKLDYPVSLGGYKHSRRPSEPIGLHLVHVPNESNPGMEARDMFRIGRMKLLEMSFDDFEVRVRDELDRMLGAGGFSSARDIAAITVNRWAHGYAYGENTLFDPPGSADETRKAARRPHGRVAIANSDAGWSAYAHSAIGQAKRAVDEVL
ncbi:FAD-dependent oxidoreductase [Pseudorhodoplanes sp.]|uniref:FAD-dependent oxidoreductase n=1 Tax=Pseudorhodoplanes sp. TaxID=1934341 RepID=UPI002B921065|nr:FAD-dependent oxidoreductase [Pseudorhodoplanes sp.]HWV54923.1 FAD-dependent oxidoreductase [Pseudorhodoplanes sp.]